MYAESFDNVCSVFWTGSHWFALQVRELYLVQVLICKPMQTSLNDLANVSVTFQTRFCINGILDSFRIDLHWFVLQVTKHKVVSVLQSSHFTQKTKLYSLLNIEVLWNWYLHARRHFSNFSKIRVKFAPAGTVRQANRLPPIYRVCSLSTLPKRHLTYKSDKCVNQLLFSLHNSFTSLFSNFHAPIVIENTHFERNVI